MSVGRNEQNHQELLLELKALPIWSPSQTKNGKTKAPFYDINKPDTHQTFNEALDLQNNIHNIHNNHNTNSGRTSEGVESLYIGLMPSLADQYIYLDYDIDPTGENNYKHKKISNSFLKHLRQFPTYTEVSLNGHGLHCIYKLKARDYESLKALKLTRVTAKALDAPFTGEIMFSSSFLIMTQSLYHHPDNETNLADIQTINLEELTKIAPVLKHKIGATASVIGIHSKQRLSTIPDINDMRDRLLKLPATLDFYVTRAYEQLKSPMSPNSYDHWVNVAMCLAHAALQHNDVVVQHEYYVLFDEWSQTDLNGYVDANDTMAKWDSCMSSTVKRIQEENEYNPPLTKAMLHKLVNLCYPSYDERDVKGVPIWESTKNLEATIAFHGLVFKADVYSFDSLYVEGHKEVADRIFGATHDCTPAEGSKTKVTVYLKDIDLALRKVLEASQYFIPAITKCLKPLRALAVRKIDLDTNTNVHDKFKAFIDEIPWDKTPRVQSVIDTLHFDKYTDDRIISHYRDGLYKCLLWLTAVRYHGKPASAPTVPILVGSEGIYKSTWVKSLLHGTPFAQQYVRPVNGLMNDRKELSRALQSTLIALIDEIEEVLTNANKAKDILTEETLSLRAHYTNKYVNTMKRGLLLGTTNSMMMNASDGGNRRYLRITVQQCDTSTLWTIDMQQVYAELKHDYLEFVKQGNLMPWVFTDAENKLNNEIMNGASTSSESGALLEEFFGGRPEDFKFDPQELRGIRKGLKQNMQLVKEGRATTVRKLTNDLVSYLQEQNFNVAVRPPKSIAVQRRLQSFAAKYTNSSHLAVNVTGDITIKNGLLRAKGQKLFIVPQRKGVDYES